ncbi:cyclic pyranopterin monophosphate synthase [Marchantia polymorpha subsp. ruderalis]|uniref:cyclic pyranopterin monophosphate synthase n=2 Tax=Marchantia polymorpha TaxID=3197 RepID=A0A176VUH1_MARPO|nr:hypothetical protein AXG93_333s1170 [Marchantia polymorpha subsp. ruderalis]PTQ38077.1 hypothetical protein MARPO_0053s0024 [Marchantia polymorpha]BBN13876.1 hypothetical protein Mp_6g07100 [Marchantia polymorpha subsp. ruderalis]|eukprot:PTQ38077.1 hypothetical protein MARPO_0053s0024 [Marchantia polymorpha]
MLTVRRAVIEGRALLSRRLAGFGNESTSHEIRSFSQNLRSFSRKSGDDFVDDFNKELEVVFGRSLDSPSQWGELVASENLNAGLSMHRQFSDDDLSSESSNLDEGVFRLNALTHVDGSGKASMVNVVEKQDTKRVAVASGKVFLGPTAFQLVAENNIAKGDVLTVAKIAGIQGAKQTSSLIPLCHNILLSGVDVSLTLNEPLHAVDIRAEATAAGPTGVEMEALTAVSVASLTVYDMCKAVSKNIRIGNVQLESKTGGKSGDWYRD